MASFKRLKRSDVISVPYAANKNWIFEYCPYPENDQNVAIYKGTNVTGSFNSILDPVTEKQYERLIYSQINHLYYQQYSASADLINTGSLLSSAYYEGVSQIKATGSYYNYNENPGLIKSFPTGAMEGIRVLTINQNLYGQQITPYHFQLSSQAYNITDDGIGNLRDVSLAGNTYAINYAFNYTEEASEINNYIGNVFYSHGIAVITNQDYQLMFPVPPLAQYLETTVFDSDEPKLIDLTESVAARGNTIDYASFTFFNNDYELFTNNEDGTATLDTIEIGSYTTDYRFDAEVPGSDCEDNILTSNDSTIKVNVIRNCDFTFTATSNPFPTPTPTPIPPTPTPTPIPGATPTPTPVGIPITFVNNVGINSTEGYTTYTAICGINSIYTWNLRQQVQLFYYDINGTAQTTYIPAGTTTIYIYDGIDFIKGQFSYRVINEQVSQNANCGMKTISYDSYDGVPDYSRFYNGVNTSYSDITEANGGLIQTSVISLARTNRGMGFWNSAASLGAGFENYVVPKTISFDYRVYQAIATPTPTPIPPVETPTPTPISTKFTIYRPSLLAAFQTSDQACSQAASYAAEVYVEGVESSLANAIANNKRFFTIPSLTPGLYFSHPNSGYYKDNSLANTGYTLYLSADGFASEYKLCSPPPPAPGPPKPTPPPSHAFNLSYGNFNQVSVCESGNNDIFATIYGDNADITLCTDLWFDPFLKQKWSSIYWHRVLGYKPNIAIRKVNDFLSKAEFYYCDSCTVYTLTNLDSFYNGSAWFIDCSGMRVEVTIPKNTSIDFCVQKDQTPVPYVTTIQVTHKNQPCTIAEYPLPTPLPEPKLLYYSAAGPNADYESTTPCYSIANQSNPWNFTATVSSTLGFAIAADDIVYSDQWLQNKAADGWYIMREAFNGNAAPIRVKISGGEGKVELISLCTDDPNAGGIPIVTPG
jgi:hypothetical protein